MSSIVRYCLLQLDRVRSVENLLRRLDEEGYDVASGSFDPEDAKAWIVEVRRYSALRPEKGLVGWDNVERMREWHDAVETRAVGEVAQSRHSFRKTHLTDLAPCLCSFSLLDRDRRPPASHVAWFDCLERNGQLETSLLLPLLFVSRQFTLTMSALLILLFQISASVDLFM